MKIAVSACLLGENCKYNGGNNYAAQIAEKLSGEEILPEGGTIEFKTDNTELFNFSLEQIKEAGWTLQRFTYDLHHHEELNKDNVMTEYEEKFSQKGNPINMLIAVRK